MPYKRPGLGFNKAAREKNQLPDVGDDDAVYGRLGELRNAVFKHRPNPRPPWTYRRELQRTQPNMDENERAQRDRFWKAFDTAMQDEDEDPDAVRMRMRQKSLEYDLTPDMADEVMDDWEDRMFYGRGRND